MDEDSIPNVPPRRKRLDVRVDSCFCGKLCYPQGMEHSSPDGVEIRSVEARRSPGDQATIMVQSLQPRASSVCKEVALRPHVASAQKCVPLRQANVDRPELSRLRLRKGNDKHYWPSYMWRDDHDGSPFRHLRLFVPTEIAQENGPWLWPKRQRQMQLLGGVRFSDSEPSNMLCHMGGVLLRSEPTSRAMITQGVR